jgi:hypothetical protein
MWPTLISLLLLDDRDNFLFLSYSYSLVILSYGLLDFLPKDHTSLYLLLKCVLQHKDLQILF